MLSALLSFTLTCPLLIFGPYPVYGPTYRPCAYCMESSWWHIFQRIPRCNRDTASQSSACYRPCPMWVSLCMIHIHCGLPVGRGPFFILLFCCEILKACREVPPDLCLSHEQLASPFHSFLHSHYTPGLPCLFTQEDVLIKYLSLKNSTHHAS